MLNLFRNVSQKIVKQQFSLNALNQSIDKTVTRHSSILCKVHKSVNQDQLEWNQLPLRRTQLPSVRSSRYSTDSKKPNENADDGNGEKVQRTLPKLINEKIVCGPPIFAFFKNRLKTMQIRQSLDSEFRLDEFVEGSKKAIEVNGHVKSQNENEAFILLLFCFCSCRLCPTNWQWLTLMGCVV